MKCKHCGREIVPFNCELGYIHSHGGAATGYIHCGYYDDSLGFNVRAEPIDGQLTIPPFFQEDILSRLDDVMVPDTRPLRKLRL